MNTDDLYRLLRTGHAQAQGIIDTIANPLLVLDGKLCVVAASRSFYETFDVDSFETIGQPLYELGNGQWNIPELRHLLEEVIPKAMAVVNYEVQHDFPHVGRRTMLLSACTLHDPPRNSRTMLLTITDATDERRRVHAQNLLFGELRHRLKNLLGVAQSIATQMPTKGRSAEDYRDAFLGRFAALIEAENLAFDEHEPCTLHELLRRILAPYAVDEARIVLERSPDVLLTPRTSMALSLILHEMATNAAKHGALSVPAGRVHVRHVLEDEARTLRLSWSESGGPPVAAPSAVGYGSIVIKVTTTHTLGGKLELDYAPGGFRAHIIIPLASGGAPQADVRKQEDDPHH